VDNYPDHDELIRKLASKVHDRGLAAPAILFLELYKPFSYLSGQCMLLAQPLLDCFTGSFSIGQLAELLDDDQAVERLIRYLEGGAEMQSPHAKEGIR
jgi:hypothetical protein